MDNKQGLFDIKDGIYLIIAPLVIILPISYWYLTAPPPGWCVEQNRVLSEKEVIELAGVYTVKQYGQKMIDGKQSPALLCCGVYRIEGGFWSKMFRIDEGISIYWWYERSEEVMKIHDPNYKYYSIDITVDSCAVKWLSQTGIVEKEADYVRSRDSYYSKK